MSADFQELEDILERVKLLPPEYRVRLMQGILNSLLTTSPPNQTGVVQFGEFKEYDGPLSTIQDFAIAEWRPSELEWNGE